MDDEIYKLKAENERLRVAMELLRLKIEEKEKTVDEIVSEKFKHKDINQNALLLEKELQSQIETWEKIIDEMAHTINTDVFHISHFLSKVEKSEPLKKALYHTNQIRDLMNLIMLDLKKDQIEIDNTLVEISLEELVKTQLGLIKGALSTLRLSEDEHEENLEKLEIPINILSESQLSVCKSFKDAIIVIVKDLLRNALKNTDESNPNVEIKIYKNHDNICLEIQNNVAISQEFADWFNGQTETEPQISKSSKVGLRVIKKWTKLLQINAQLIPDYKSNKTISLVSFPREMIYEG